MVYSGQPQPNKTMHSGRISHFPKSTMIKLALALLMLCASCATPSVIVRQNAHIERLGIYLETGEHAIPIVTNQFDMTLDNYIEAHNAKPRRPFELFRAQANDSSTLRIKLITTQFVSRGDQTAGVLVSMAGLSLPFLMAAADSPIVVFFYYFPNVKSMTELSLSADINGSTQAYQESVLASPGFLKSPENQIKKHTVSFERFLKQLVIQVSRQTRKK
jgi:hypothetical protein